MWDLSCGWHTLSPLAGPPCVAWYHPAFCWLSPPVPCRATVRGVVPSCTLLALPSSPLQAHRAWRRTVLHSAGFLPWAHRPWMGSGVPGPRALPATTMTAMDTRVGTRDTLRVGTRGTPMEALKSTPPIPVPDTPTNLRMTDGNDYTTDIHNTIRLFLLYFRFSKAEIKPHSEGFTQRCHWTPPLAYYLPWAIYIKKKICR